MKKYLFILDYNFRSVNLVSQFFEAFFSALTERGHQVTVVLPILPSEPFLSGFKNSGIQVVVCDPWRTIADDAHSQKRIRPIAKLCYGLQKDHRFDFISFHFCDPLMVVVCGLMIRLHWARGATQLFFHQHNEVLTMEKRLGKIRLFKRFFSKLGLLSFLVDRIICVYALGAHNLVTKGIPGKRADYIHNGMTVEKIPGEREEIRQALGLAEDEIAGLYVGRLINGKGVDILVKAFARLTKQTDYCRLFIVGEGNESQSLKRLAQGTCPEGSVIFLGYRKDVPELMEAADFLLLPSRTEALPSVIIEAGHHGLPVVASTVGGIPEMIRDNETGMLVDSFDVEAWEKAIRSLVDTPETLNRYRIKCRSFMEENFSLNKVLTEYLTRYEADTA